MAGATKTIKARIKSVKNTKKITKAMEMVSAAKMRKAVDAALRTRLYAQLAGELMERLSALDVPEYPLFRKDPVKKMLMILITSNRGLCGNFNSNVMKFAQTQLQEKIQIDVLGIGRKSASFAKKAGLNLIAVFDHLSENPDSADVQPITQMAVDVFKKEEYEKVVIVYTHFASSLQQDPKIRQLLPISEGDFVQGEHELGEINTETYLLEPDSEAILHYVIPKLIESEFYQAVLESSASEHSARMVAMKNATEAAGEMIDTLTLVFNKARQAAITQEIAEIAGGAAALE